MAIICLVSTIFIINIYHKRSDHPVPSNLLTLTYALSKTMCKNKNITKKKVAIQVQVQEQNNLETKQNKEKLNEVKSVNDVRVNDDHQDLNDWKTVAMVLDKFLFYLFFFLTTTAKYKLSSLSSLTCAGRIQTKLLISYHFLLSNSFTEYISQSRSRNSHMLSILNCLTDEEAD